MTRPLTDFKILSFDCYGTLIDWETGIWDALQPLLAAGGSDLPSRKEALRAHAKHEHATESQTPERPYTEILARVHELIAAEFGLETDATMNSAFGRSVAHWPAFSDSAVALRSLSQHFKLVILSNVDRAGIAASLRKLGVRFDAVYTAEDIGSYKPAARNFDYMLDRLAETFDCPPDGILHTAQSLFHDHVPANRHGLANAWIDRQRLSQDGDWGATCQVDDMPQVDFRFFSLKEMADAVLADAG